MDNYLSLEEIKQIEIQILDYVVDICEQNKLRYYLMYGTLIGAIRHKGFIPWDDDIDIAMPRPDYDKFIEITTNIDKNRFQVFSSNNIDYFLGFGKVVDNHTQIVETETIYSPDKKIWIDIFPFDGTPNPNAFHSKLCYIINKCRAAAVYPCFPKGKGGNYLYWKICRMIGYKFFLNWYEKLCRKYKYDESEYVGLLSNRIEIFPRKMFRDTTKVEFEKKKYNAPIDYEGVLTINFGDYMQLPPENQRITHHIKAIRI
jgi:lipopolysaccharide cholinephosphotransferase